MTSSSKGITISVTAETNPGCRRHMEDYLAVKLSPSEEFSRVPHLREQAYIGVFDGHGGKEAAKCARERLWDIIQNQPKYKLADLSGVKESIEDAFIALHSEMEPLRATWKRNKTGDLSTAGTTATTIIFRQDHIFVANVGDSTAVLATSNPLAEQPNQHPIKALVLTKDHKPEDPEEISNINNLGGNVMTSRKGVPRVVWRRPKKFGDEGVFDSIPFLSVSRSLGDFWSYNPRTNRFTVSPKPDVHVHPLDPKHQKFVVIASDGLWNVMSPDEVVRFIWDYEHDKDECHQPRDVVRAVINEALRRWTRKRLPADNIAVLIAFLTEAVVPPPASSPSNPATAAAEDEETSHAQEASLILETSTAVLESPPASPSLLDSPSQYTPPVSAAEDPSSKPVALEYGPVITAHRIDRVADENLKRSPLKTSPTISSSSPIGKHDRSEDTLENTDELPSLKRIRVEPAVKSGLSEALVDDDSGVCSDDNLSHPAVCGPPLLEN